MHAGTALTNGTMPLITLVGVVGLTLYALARLARLARKIREREESLENRGSAILFEAQLRGRIANQHREATEADSHIAPE